MEKLKLKILTYKDHYNLLPYFLRILSVFYFLGFALHFLDLFGFRLEFSSMTLLWKLWILFLLILDFLASAGLWFQKIWGEWIFLVVCFSQLFAYTFFAQFFGDQKILIIFHLTTLSIYLILKLFDKNFVTNNNSSKNLL